MLTKIWDSQHTRKQRDELIGDHSLQGGYINTQQDWERTEYIDWNKTIRLLHLWLHKLLRKGNMHNTAYVHWLGQPIVPGHEPPVHQVLQKRCNVFTFTFWSPDGLYSLVPWNFSMIIQIYCTNRRERQHNRPGWQCNRSAKWTKGKHKPRNNEWKSGNEEGGARLVMVMSLVHTQVPYIVHLSVASMAFAP